MTTANPCGVFIADHTTPSDAATATRPSGITKCTEPLGVPGLYGSLDERANMMSTPPWRGSPGRGELKPSEITGARPFQRGTGQIQRPGNVPVNGAASAVLPLAACELRRVSAYATAPPPMIQGHTRTSRLLVVTAAAG